MSSREHRRVAWAFRAMGAAICLTVVADVIAQVAFGSTPMNENRVGVLIGGWAWLYVAELHRYIASLKHGEATRDDVEARRWAG